MKTINSALTRRSGLFENAFTPFDWKSFLGQKSFTLVSLIECQMRSGDWMSCALGQEDSHYNRKLVTSAAGRPKDRTLVFLGHEFHEAIQSMVNEWEDYPEQSPGFERARSRAQDVLISIKRRTQKLLNPDTSSRPVNTTGKEADLVGAA